MKNFSWQAPEYVHIEKSPDWYWTVTITASALVIVSIIFGNILFALVLAIGTFTLTLFSIRKPNIINFEVNEKGVRLEKTFYPFITLESFGIDAEHHHGPKLHLKSKKVVMPLISPPLHPDHVEPLKEFLVIYLKEETFEENLMHTLFERLGF